MTRDRIYDLMGLVLDAREPLGEKEILVSFEIEWDSENICIFSSEVSFKYSTDCLDGFKKDNYTRIHDEDLKQAEAHLRRLLNNVD